MSHPTIHGLPYTNHPPGLTWTFAALGTDAGDEDRQIRGDRPHVRELGRVRRADHEPAVAEL